MWARSYTVRAMLAVGFLLLYYTATLGVAVVLLSLPFRVDTTHRFHALFAALCLAGAGAILWSLLPQRERFVSPGPRLTEDAHPRLFAALRDVARRMEVELPPEVFLVEDVNAYVTQVGGFLGFGSRRILCIGLGLLAVDNLSQFRAAVAHELGHFKGGETKLAAVIYSTRSSMSRALSFLGEDDRMPLRKPFTWVPKLFLLITQSISRQQELVADEWSIRIAGRHAHISGLRRESLHAVAYRRFLEHEVYPLAHEDVVPDNLFEGFRRYLASSAWAEAQRELAGGVPEREAGSYDSHPCMKERIAFAERMDGVEQPLDETPAYTLLSDAEALERRFTAELWPNAVELIPWAGVGARWSVLWNETASRVQARVPEFSLARVPSLLKDAAARESFAEAVDPRLVGYRAPDRTERVHEVVGHAVSAYLASILARHGMAWTTSPGESLELEWNGERVDPTALVEEWLAGTGGPEELEPLRKRLGVAEDATWSVEEEERVKALAPRAPVTLRRVGDAVTVRAPLARMGLPHCCALCGGALAHHVETRFHVGGMMRDDGEITIQVPTCEAHARQSHKAFKVRRYEEESGFITLEVPDLAYARLIQRSNA
ncbi:M48 family metallopeptidase [Archangium violaceum]|uniref:M48 family metallopeptidase n=1 Tax=Archangium violaceum TaxID=83451 RepID=UPI00193B97B2|nr:M48 family metallopeptidase [Archangium violaceum]QRK09569.1 M48 family metallopeptidase [Archangium violaceum]